MPLLDHFRPPLHPQRHWESFHANWAGAMADVLNEDLLPEGYFAEEQAHSGGRIEIDVATFESAAPPATTKDGATATLPPRVWAPPAPALSMPGVFPDNFEVQIFRGEGGATLVAAIELISPANKDRQDARIAFAAKCASYLAQGIGVLMVDMVTTRRANLHNELVHLLKREDHLLLPASTDLYAVAYRAVTSRESPRVEVWSEPLALGEALPVMPLWFSLDLCVPLRLDESYRTTCESLRISA